MSEQEQKAASEGIVVQSASTGGLGGERRDIVERLRDTPNWMRESWGGWKDCTMQYDRAPFEAADEIERLRTLASDAYEAWDSDRDSRVGKLLWAMLDGKFCATYRPDLPPNAGVTGAELAKRPR